MKILIDTENGYVEVFKYKLTEGKPHFNRFISDLFELLHNSFKFKINYRSESEDFSINIFDENDEPKESESEFYLDSVFYDWGSNADLSGEIKNCVSYSYNVSNKVID